MRASAPRYKATISSRAVTALLAALFLPGAALAADEIHWTMVDPTTVAVDWRGAGRTLRYGLTSAYDHTLNGGTPYIVPFSSPGPFWEAQLAGLVAGRTYHYSVDGGPDHTFHTLPGPGSSFTVFAEGDIGSSSTYDTVSPVQSMIAAGSPSFVLAVGDLTYGDQDGIANVDQHFNDVMVWSQDAAYMPAWGNHEWTKPTDDMRNYKGRFAIPNPQTSPGAPSAGCCGKDWSWFDAGNTRFIAYPEPFTGAWSNWLTIAGALMDQAQADPAIHFIVTFGHRPAYSSGYHAGDPELQAYMDTLGARHSKYVLNLNGHSHDYERSIPRSGVTHVTIGIGGATLETSGTTCPWGGGCPPPAWSAYRAFHHGALKLDFEPYRIHGQVLCGPASSLDDIQCAPGTVIDEFSIASEAPPVFAGVPGNESVAVGQPVTIHFDVSDPDGEPITSLVANLSSLPAGGNEHFTAGPGDTTGQFTWTPGPADIGTHVVTFRAANALTAAASMVIDVHGVTAVPGGAPPALALGDIHPYPAGSSFTLDYSLGDGSEARLELLDVAGRLERRIALETSGPGRHEMRIGTGSAIEPGVYWLRLTQSGHVALERVVLRR